jgi:hypothetical protein
VQPAGSQIRPCHDGRGAVRTVTPYDAYRLYQIQRTKSSAEIRHADEQAARIASALAALFDVITRRRRIAANGRPAPWRVLPEHD